MLRINQSGETIVEVLISIAVIASALGGAFAIANRSQKSVQANQERFSAQLFANSQAEAIRAYLAADSGTGANRATLKGAPITNDGATAFCMNSGGLPVVVTDSACNDINGLYKIEVTHPGGSPTGAKYDIFTVKVTWDSLVNSIQDNVELKYGT